MDTASHVPEELELGTVQGRAASGAEAWSDITVEIAR